MNKLTMNLLAAFIFLLLSPEIFAQTIIKTAGGVYTTREIRAKIKVGDRTTLQIRAASNLPGKLTIEVARTDKVKISYFKKAKANSMDDAVDYIDLIAVVLRRGPKDIKLELRSPNPAPWTDDNQWGRVEARITIPENYSVLIEAPLFDVTAVGPFRSIVIPSSLGRINIKNVTERLEVSTTNRRLDVSDITGEISLATSNSVLTAKNLVSLDKRADIENENGDIRIRGFKGELYVEGSYGRIQLSDFYITGRRNIIKGMSGPIKLEISGIDRAQLRITNRFEDIEINLPDSISAAFSLVVDEGGKIEVSNINFRSELIEHNRMNLVSGNGQSIISGSVRGSGNIYIRGYDD
ncbi:MAG: hypothetical protein IIC66_02865 [candidate division Zixibacteria bacterium]|nr:hypothetical protein [candidate division Zixibacteria bacterium]